MDRQPLSVPADDAARAEALRRYAILDSPPEEVFDRITRLAARIFGVPFSLVSLVEAHRQWFKSCYGLDVRETEREVSFCARAIETGGVMVVPDALRDPRFAGNRQVTGDPGIRFYAGAPLRTPGGVQLGTLCVIDTRPRQFSAEECATLADLAAMVMDAMEQRLATATIQETKRRLHQSEARWRALTEHSLDVVSILDAAGTILYQSPSVERVLGYAPEELLGRNAFDFVHPENLPAVLEGFQAAVADPTLVRQVDFRFRARDGSWRWLEGIGKCHLDDPSIAGIVVNSRDITERRQAKEIAERANRAKSEFLSRMSHELRTPLNAILGFGQLLEGESLSPDDRESVEHILRAGRHLLGLIEEILDISRIETERMKLVPEPVALGEAVRQAAEMVRPLAGVRGVVLEVQADDATHLWADRQRLKQVLLNLLSNAIKYNREGGRAEVSWEQAAGERVRLRVTDQGAGIAPTDVERLFSPFERLGAERRGVEGTGLGLALSKGLAEAMGGVLGVESHPGSGSTFWVELPLLGAANLAAVAAQPEETRRVVLCIEDSEISLQLIKHALAERPGVRVIAAAHGAHGLMLAERHRPHLVLLDLGLPDLTGEEVMRRLRENPITRATPVVVISADASPDRLQHLLDLGAYGYLAKPLDLRELVQLADTLLDVGEH